MRHISRFLMGQTFPKSGFIEHIVSRCLEYIRNVTNLFPQINTAYEHSLRLHEN